jgi:hypothetical protein
MLGAPSDCLCWTEVSWSLIYYTRTMLKNHHDVNALSSLTDDCQLRFKMFDERGSMNRLIWSCNCMTILWVTNPNFGLAHKLPMIYLPHIWSCYQFGLRASPPIFYLSLCWCYHIWHKMLIIPQYPLIYLWSELVSYFVCLFCFVCHVEISQIMGPLVGLLVPLESPWWVEVHWVGFIIFPLTVGKLLNIE